MFQTFGVINEMFCYEISKIVLEYMDFEPSPLILNHSPSSQEEKYMTFLIKQCLKRYIEYEKETWFSLRPTTSLEKTAAWVTEAMELLWDS